MKFLSKRVCDYTSFHSVLDPTKHGRSSGGVSLFIHNYLATHIQDYKSHSSRILSVDLYFKGNVKLLSPAQWTEFADDFDALCSAEQFIYDTWPLNQKCEYLHSHIIKAAKAKLPSTTVGNTYVPKKPKDLESLIQFILSTYKTTFTTPLLFPSSLPNLLNILEQMTSLLQDHPIQTTLLTSPYEIDKVVNHFQNFVPISSVPPSSIHDLLKRWFDVYKPLDDVPSGIYDTLMDPPTLDKWSSTVSSMPNDKTPGPSMISYEMLKHLSPRASSLLLSLVNACLLNANIPYLWRQAVVFPIPKPHEWKCQLKNTRPIILLEVIHKTLSIIHDSVVTKQPLWILFQDISKAFDSVDLNMLKFALQRLRLPSDAIQFLLSLLLQHMVPLLLTESALNNKKDPYCLISPSVPTSLSSSLDQANILQVNNLVFMDDSTLISSSKSGMEHMLSITEEFYCLNNTSANHKKYVLFNSTDNITVAPISMSSSFHFLGYVVYLHNTVLIPKLEYRMQVTHLTEAEYYTATSSVQTLVKHKAKLSRSTPNAILHLSQALGLINLFAHQQQCHFTNLFLLANSSSAFMSSLFLYSTIASLVSTLFHISRAVFASVSALIYPNGHTPLYHCLSIDTFKSNLSHLRKHARHSLDFLDTGLLDEPGLEGRQTLRRTWTLKGARLLDEPGLERYVVWPDARLLDEPGLEGC
ncbi:unnamed protein product [Rhizophagus irregularis]|nr:unnamed protein product [Rhizophagus irregularis]